MQGRRPGGGADVLGVTQAREKEKGVEQRVRERRCIGSAGGEGKGRSGRGEEPAARGHGGEGGRRGVGEEEVDHGRERRVQGEDKRENLK